MNNEMEQNAEDALAAALATVEIQKQRIALLQRQVEDDHEAEQLRNEFILVASARTIAEPITHDQLLEMIVQTAARVLFARAASLFLVDIDKRELVFEVAIGPNANKAKRYRVPLGHGIAGLVAVTGQPMAIADAGSSALHASDISQSIGYVPNSILCAPLFYHDQVIGVLEVLDKVDNTAFDGDDMELVSMFANQAAVAIELSRTHNYLATLFADMLQPLDQNTEAHKTREELLLHVRRFAERLDDDSAIKDALELATLLHEVFWYGESERAASRELLEGFVRYLRQRPMPGSGRHDGHLQAT